MSSQFSKWQKFKKNRKGYYSFVILFIFFLLSLGAELLMNDKPIVVQYNGDYYFPIVKSYPETTFGGQFETETNYHDPYIQDKIEDNGFAIWPPFQYRYDTFIYQNQDSFPTPPDGQHWLGTTDAGTDVLANIVYGFRISILFALILTTITSIIGVCIGAIQGYFGGWIDLIGQRILEVWENMPTLFVIILISSLISLNFWWLLLIIICFSWMSLVNVVRSEFLRARNFDYVTAARAMGVSSKRIIFRHILPNAMVSIFTFVPFILCGSIITLTSLDFLGFGLSLESPSLGRLLVQGKNNLQAPWLGLSAFFITAIILTLLIFIGEAIRDAFNVNEKKHYAN